MKTKICTNCGTELETDWKLCPNCGTNVIDLDDPQLFHQSIGNEIQGGFKNPYQLSSVVSSQVNNTSSKKNKAGILSLFFFIYYESSW